MPRFWTECYEAHFQKLLHKPFDIQIYHDADGNALKIATYDQALPNYRVFASMGLADRLAAKDEDDLGEVLLFSDVPDREVPSLFVHALFFILQHDIPLSSRFAIGGVAQLQPAFAKRHDKASLYFTLASSGEDEATAKVRNGEEFGHVYQAYFISAEEDRYLTEHGADEFEKQLAAQEGDRNSIRRPSFTQ